jgi:hypothetical protein
MSTGAVFKLIANDGKADRMIMATKLLNQRIKDVMCARNAAGKADITPTLVDLERTHILYVNAHFKPFAAIGYEYNKVRPQSGSAILGTGVTFSIPQFGDFFHDMVCRVRLSAAYANAYAIPALGTAQFPVNVAQTSTVSAKFYNIVDAFGNIVAPGGSAAAASVGQVQNLVRYCEFPGNRLFNNVKFDVNGNPLDSYDYMVPTMLEKFCTPPHKRAGFNRLVGQENILDGYSGPKQARAVDPDALVSAGLQTPAGVINKNTTGQSNQTVGVFGIGAATQVADSVLGNGGLISTTNLNTGILSSTIASTPAQAWPWGFNAGTAAPAQYDISREYKQYLSGPQTPKPVQPALEIWNKLRFWFNDDVRLSIPSVSIPFGQRFITIEMAQSANMVFEFPSLFLETIYNDTTASTLSAQVGAPGIYQPEVGDALQQRIKTYSPLGLIGGINSAFAIEAVELYINNIFVNPEVHDIYIKRIGFSLIRVYRQQVQRTQYATSEVLLSQLKWPIEYMFVGARPVWNVTPYTGPTAGNAYMWRDWHRLTHVINGDVDEYSYSESAAASGGVSGLSSGVSGYITNSSAPTSSTMYSVVPDQYYLPVPTVDSLALTSHGIVIFENFQDQFFNSYMPFHYGGTSLSTPEDVGALFVNMALFPRSYQPSGHLNISRARETYLKWNSTYISTSSAVDIFIVAVAINFLLITDGSAVLRYST